MKNRVFSDAEMEKQKEYTASVAEYVKGMSKAAGRNLRVYVMTLGCQQNEADSEKILGMAESMGYVPTDNPGAADLIVVNTCAIREHAEQRALSFIGSYKKLKAENPYLIIGVCGCMAAEEHRREEIKRSYPYVDFVFGTSALHRMPQYIFERIHDGRRVFAEQDEGDFLVAEGIPISRRDSAHAWVSVMYGCNNFCSYCIVPYVRGRERSRQKDKIVNEVRDLIADGVRDITLLGQNVNSYGKDGDYAYDFADLLEEIACLDGDFILRFMTSHPKDATHKLIDVMAKYKKIAPHFHLPVQSGSDRILKLMNRRYDVEKYLLTVEYLRDRVPDITLTTDIIVGFPGETEEDFNMTLDLLRRVRFDMIYSFIYSPRVGTPAAKMEDFTSEEEKKRRYAELLEVQGKISLAKNLPLVGKTLRVLCDGVSKTNSSLMSGRTEGNKIVFFDGDVGETGKFVYVRINRAEAFSLYGERTDEVPNDMV